MEQQTGSKSGEKYIKAVHCHPAYLTSMQSTTWETLGWRKHKLESRLLGEISITSRYVDDTTLMAEREELTSFLMKVKKESEKAALKLNVQKTKIMASGPIQFSSVAQSCPTLCDPMNRSTPGLRGYWYFSQQSWFQLVLPPACAFSWCTLHRS